MKLGFNEANDRFCKNHSVMMDLELCRMTASSGRSFVCRRSAILPKNIRAALRKFRLHRSETIQKVYPLYGNYRGYFLSENKCISRFFVGNDRNLSYKADCAVDFACLSAKLW